MKMFVCFFAFFSVLSTQNFGQFLPYPEEYKSIHQLEAEIHENDPVMESLFDKDGKGIIPLQYDKSKTTGASIFGYLPDWEYQNAKTYLRYDILTHIAAFDFQVSTSGVVTNPSYWPWTDVINKAHLNGVKVILCVTNFTGSQIHTIITDQTVKQNFFNNVLSKMNQYQLDGINIDFESLNVADRGDVINGFMTDLTAFIKGTKPEAEISFAGPAVNWSGWKLQGLANSCDYIFIMGYDFYGSWSTQTGPSAPYTGGSYNITNTVNVQYASPTTTTPNKLILGVPYFGAKWISATQNPNSPVKSWVGSTRFSNDQPNSQNYGLQWASNYQVPWYRWQRDDTSWYQVWFDNDSSLGIKYVLAKSKNLKGVGMWALGYDGARQELWNELYKRFYPVVPVKLTSFSGSVEGNKVLLNWVTMIEENTMGFRIEKYHLDSNNGGAGVVVASVNSQKGVSGIKNYSLSDICYEKGKYLYKLYSIDYDGSFELAGETEVEIFGKELSFELNQNFPNPFNPSTSISFTVAFESRIKLELYTVLGEKVADLIDKVYSRGSYSFSFNAEDYSLNSGIYLYVLKAGEKTLIKKMCLTK